MSMENAFLLEHLHIISEQNECIKTIGVYASEEDAREAVLRLCNKPGFSASCEINPADGVSGFYISRYKIGHDHWTDGFVTIDT